MYAKVNLEFSLCVIGKFDKTFAKKIQLYIET